MEKTKNRAPRAHDLLLQRLVFCKSNKLLVPFTVDLVVGPMGYLIDIRHVYMARKRYIEERGPSQC